MVHRVGWQQDRHGPSPASGFEVQLPLNSRTARCAVDHRGEDAPLHRLSHDATPTAPRTSPGPAVRWVGAVPTAIAETLSARQGVPQGGVVPRTARRDDQMTRNLSPHLVRRSVSAVALALAVAVLILLRYRDPYRRQSPVGRSASFPRSHRGSPPHPTVAPQPIEDANQVFHPMKLSVHLPELTLVPSTKT